MVLGAKKTMNGSGKGGISVMKLHKMAAHKRHSLARVLYGSLLIMVSIILMVIDPLVLVTEHIVEMKEGRLLYEMLREPTYEVFLDTYIFNYTNLHAFLDGTDRKLKLDEIGPFVFKEKRTDENMTVDNDRGVLTMKPRVKLTFLPERSVADTKDLRVVVPNLVMISFSTFLADNMGYFTNVGAYLSMKGVGSKLVLNITAEEWLWGYEDPLVSIANKLIPSWIDFEKAGIMDRFYAYKNNTVEIDVRNRSRLYAINLWDKSPGLVQQGYTDWETSNNCNRLRDAYEGLIISPGISKDKILNIYRSYGCKVFPFQFTEEVNFHGLKGYRFDIQDSAFNRTSPYACPCTKNCLPDGFMDISGCYYGFPIALSKPHLLDVDPQQQQFYEGLHPDPSVPTSYTIYEPEIGAPLQVVTRLQINLAVRTNAGNPLAQPFKDMVLPLLHIKMYCDMPPKDIMDKLIQRLVYGPPALMATISLLLITGTYLGLRGFYDYFNPVEGATHRNVGANGGASGRNSTGLLADHMQRELDDIPKERTLLLKHTEGLRISGHEEV